MTYAINAAGTEITQTGTDADLSGLLSVAGVAAVTTRTFEGLTAVYTLDRDVKILIDGTQTINPEVNKLVGDENEIVRVQNGGILNLGEFIAAENRFTVGAAIQNNRAQQVWFAGNGNQASININSGGTIIAAGCSVKTMGSINFNAGSTGWIRSLDLLPQDLSVGQTNPTTGAVVTGADPNEEGIISGILFAGRGFLGQSFTTDLRIDDLSIFGGGEFTLQVEPSGTNSASGTPNGLFGYSAQGAVVGFFPQFNLTNITLTDSAIGNSGNDIDVTAQRPNSTTAANPTRQYINELSGTNLTIIGPESTGLNRNGTYSRLQRNVNFNINDSLTGNGLNGGRYYSIDTDNGLRKSVTIGSQVNNDNPNIIYSGSLIDGSLVTDETFTLGIVNVGPSLRPRNTNNDPANTATDDLAWRMDLRGKVNTLGTDPFDIVFWHPEYNPAIFNDVLMTDGTTGTQILSANLISDANYSNTATGLSALNDVDELYDYIKQSKSADDIGIVYPTTTTLAVSKSGNNLDIGSRSFSVTTGAADPYTISDTVLTANTFLLFNNGSIFNGITTTDEFDLTNVNTSNFNIIANTITNLSTAINANSNFNGDITIPIGTYTSGNNSEFSGSWTFESGATTFNFGTNDDVSGLTLEGAAGVVLQVFNKQQSEFDAVNLNGGSITFPNTVTYQRASIDQTLRVYDATSIGSPLLELTGSGPLTGDIISTSTIDHIAVAGGPGFFPRVYKTGSFSATVTIDVAPEASNPAQNTATPGNPVLPGRVCQVTSVVAGVNGTEIVYGGNAVNLLPGTEVNKLTDSILADELWQRAIAINDVSIVEGVWRSPSDDLAIFASLTDTAFTENVSIGSIDSLQQQLQGISDEDLLKPFERRTFVAIIDGSTSTVVQCIISPNSTPSSEVIGLIAADNTETALAPRFDKLTKGVGYNAKQLNDLAVVDNYSSDDDSNAEFLDRT